MQVNTFEHAFEAQKRTQKRSHRIALLLQACGKTLAICEDTTEGRLEGGMKGLVEAHCDAGDIVVMRATLQSGEDGLVDALLVARGNELGKSIAAGNLKFSREEV